MSDINNGENLDTNIDNFFIKDSEIYSDDNKDIEAHGIATSLDTEDKIKFKNDHRHNELNKIEVYGLTTNTHTHTNKNPNPNTNTNPNQKDKLNATTGIKLIDEIPANKYSNSDSESSSDSKPKSISSENNNKNKKNILNDMLKPSDINGWDNEANITIKNWYHTFKQQSFIYQWVLDHNSKISEKLAISSILASSTLSIFTGFSLWLSNDLFRTVSSIIIILSNFIIAILTALSRHYGNDVRGESIRNYVREIDEFLGEISAQVLKAPIYRMNADDFFKQNNDNYTKLIMFAPNVSLDELNKSKKEYKSYREHIEYISV